MYLLAEYSPEGILFVWVVVGIKAHQIQQVHVEVLQEKCVAVKEPVGEAVQDCVFSLYLLLASEILAAGERKRQREESQKFSRMEMKRRREDMLQRQARLEAEIDALYHIPKRIKRITME